MNGEQIIPPVTDPSGQSWKQPHRRNIELDKTHALMSEQTFKGYQSILIPSQPESMRVKCGEPIKGANGILHGTDQTRPPATYQSNGEKY
jgi:hypothetical protein